MSFTSAWDPTKPAGSRNLNLGDDDIREFKQQVQERSDVDGYFPSTDDANTGYHRKTTLLAQGSDPAQVAGTLILYGKTTGSYAELFSRHENATLQQLTLNGKLWIPALTIASDARGDMMVRGASLWGRTAIGSNGKVWTSDGTDPSWQAAAVAFGGLPTGSVIQSYYKAFTTRVAGGTTVMPLDNTIPQSTEGHLFMTADAFTPLSASSKIYVEFGFYGTLSTNEQIIAAIFYDAVTDAIAAVSSGSTTNDLLTPIVQIASWGLTSRTFKLRGGASGGGAGLDMNGYTTQLFGGVALSWVRIWEVQG